MCSAVAGCAKPNQVDDPFGTAKAPRDDFDNGANRPPTVKTMYSLAKIAADQGRDDQAVVLLQKTIQASPTCLPAYLDLAELYMRQQQIMQAMQTLAQGLKHLPGNPQLLNNLGMCYVFLEEYNRALDLFTKAAAASPEDARYRANMALALGMLGRYEESMSLYMMAVTPDKAHYNLSVICRNRKDLPRADQEYRQALRLGLKTEGLAKSSLPPAVQ